MPRELRVFVIRKAFGKTKAGAAGPRICTDLRIARRDRPFLVHLQPRIVPKGMLDTAIFQGMKTNDPDAAAGSKHRGDSAQCCLQGPEFVVDGDSQCLECAGGGMYFLGAVGWVDIPYKPGKVDGSFEGLFRAEPHDRRGDLSA